MNKLKIILVFAVFITIVFTSCEKKEFSPNSNIINEIKESESIDNYDKLSITDMPELKVVNGTLYFFSVEQYFKTTAIVSKMTETELDKWEK